MKIIKEKKTLKISTSMPQPTQIPIKPNIMGSLWRLCFIIGSGSLLFQSAYLIIKLAIMGNQFQETYFELVWAWISVSFLGLGAIILLAIHGIQIIKVLIDWIKGKDIHFSILKHFDI